MISYLMVGTNDLPRAISYFAALMEDMGASKVYESAASAGWGWGVGTPMFIVGTPFDKKAATVGNGCMVSFGAASEGEPGMRGETLYAAYFRDPDGNKFNFICYL